MTVAGDLVELLVAAVEQADPEQRARLRAALDVEATRGREPLPTAAVYTPATLAAELGRSPRAIRGAIARGELDAVKRGRGWVISAAAVERYAATSARVSGGHTSRRRRAPGRGPMARALR